MDRGGKGVDEYPVREHWKVSAQFQNRGTRNGVGKKDEIKGKRLGLRDVERGPPSFLADVNLFVVLVNNFGI